MENTLHSFKRNSAFVEKLVSSRLFWLIAVSFFFIYPIARSIHRTLPDSLPVLYELPAFKFTNQLGKPFGSEDLEGKIYIANFFFTSCQTICPKLLSDVQKVQHRLRGVNDRAAIISFSVDPQTDTPEKLFEKANEYKANPNVWNFLTSTKEEMEKLLIDGFKVPMGEKKTAESLTDIAHSNKLVLVDQKGRIRGYYSTDKDDVNRLMIDVGLMINRNN